MTDVRVSEIAAELGYSSKEIIEKAHEMGLKKVKTANSKVSIEEATTIYNYIKTGKLPETDKPKKEPTKTKATTAKKEVKKDSDIKKSKPVQKSKSKKKSEDLEDAPLKDSKKETKEKTSIKAKKAEPKKDTISSFKQEEVKETAKKEDKKEPKIEQKSIKEEPTQTRGESLAASTLAKRRGIVIVKKRKIEKEESSNTQATAKAEKIKKLNIGLESIFSNTESNLRKKKKEQKKSPVSKKDDVKKIEILDNRDLGEISLDNEDEVVLPDLTLSSIKAEDRSQAQPRKQTNYKGGFVQNFINNNEGNISRGSRKKRKKIVKTEENEVVESINIPKEIRVYEFADKLKKQPSEVISKLFMLGVMTTKNDFLDEDAIEILADEFNVEVNIVDEEAKFDYIKAYEESEEKDSDLIERAPVVTIMGHVDHGKTSLLDYIRNSRVASGEAGGITQHVGAYMIERNGKKITFIDTPGHEAFTAMRARGAQITDVVIIVVAADDGVKPQTKEAVAHAKAAGVPFIIAINKMDKPTANPDLVKTGLSELDVMPVEWGGEYEFVPISALKGTGVDDLLDIVLLQADLLELKANPKRAAKATIVESSLQKGRGPVATIIVENGTLKVGDTVVAGVAYGKVRALTNDSGEPLKEIKPGECGIILGLSEIPEAGETLISVETDKEAREYANKKQEYLRQKELSKSTKVTIDELSAKIAEGELKTLPVIVKADVQGSLEAIKASLEKLKNDEIKVNIIHSGVGGITQNDVSLASASENTIILGFNVRPTGDVKEKAKEIGVEIKTYNVIYNMLDDIKTILGGLMSPIISEEEIGQAEVREVINVPKIGQIAGCMVTDGSIIRGAKIRVIRDGVIIFEGNISSLKRFKDDVKEVSKGYECGVGIEGYNDMKVGDYIESFKENKEQATL